MGSLCCEPTSADSSRALKKRIVTAGCDNLIKIWEEGMHKISRNLSDKKYFKMNMEIGYQQHQKAKKWLIMIGSEM